MRRHVSAALTTRAAKYCAGVPRDAPPATLRNVASTAANVRTACTALSNTSLACGSESILRMARSSLAGCSEAMAAAASGSFSSSSAGCSLGARGGAAAAAAALADIESAASPAPAPAPASGAVNPDWLEPGSSAAALAAGAGPLAAPLPAAFFLLRGGCVVLALPPAALFLPAVSCSFSFSFFVSVRGSQSARKRPHAASIAATPSGVLLTSRSIDSRSLQNSSRSRRSIGVPPATPSGRYSRASMK